MYRFAVILFACAVLAGCEDKVKPPVRDFDTRGELPSQESWNSKIVFSDSGVVRATVSASHIRVYEERMETLLDSNVIVDFYDRNGLHSSNLRADRGKVNDNTKDLEAYDNIVFKSDSGTVVKTDYLFWDSESKKVRSDKFVTITSPKEHIQGYGFEADQSLKNYVIRRVSGQAEVEE
jgi:LPS export ABC transporter protein LptC